MPNPGSAPTSSYHLNGLSTAGGVWAVGDIENNGPRFTLAMYWTGSIWTTVPTQDVLGRPVNGLTAWLPYQATTFGL